jgi:hypothetical protein
VRRIVLLPLLALAAAGCTGSHTSNVLPLAELAASGVHVSAATNHPTVTRDEAERVAKRSHRDIRGIAYRHVTDVSRHPALNTGAWVISLDPGGDTQASGPQGSSLSPQAFVVDIVDGRTGKLILQVAGAGR